MFDEHTYEHNPEPPIPERVAVAFPRRNRMGLFKGNRYHGVLVRAPSFLPPLPRLCL